MGDRARGGRPRWPAISPRHPRRAEAPDAGDARPLPGLRLRRRVHASRRTLRRPGVERADLIAGPGVLSDRRGPRRGSPPLPRSPHAVIAATVVEPRAGARRHSAHLPAPDLRAHGRPSADVGSGFGSRLRTMAGGAELGPATTVTAVGADGSVTLPAADGRSLPARAHPPRDRHPRDAARGPTRVRRPAAERADNRRLQRLVAAGGPLAFRARSSSAASLSPSRRR